MNKMVGIHEARKITLGSDDFREALSEANKCIRIAARSGKTEARVYITSYKVDVYKSLMSLLRSDGYKVDLCTIKRPRGSDEYVLDISWRFE